jgi:hypothetical protein
MNLQGSNKVQVLEIKEQCLLKKTLINHILSNQINCNKNLLTPQLIYVTLKGVKKEMNQIVLFLSFVLKTIIFRKKSFNQMMILN